MIFGLCVGAISVELRWSQFEKEGREKASLPPEEIDWR